MPSGQSLAEAILEQTAEALIYADRDGVIRRWNASAEAMFGFTAAEAIGQRLDLIIPERLREAHWRGFDAAMASGTTRLGGRPVLTRALHRSGRKLYLQMSFALVLDEAGKALGSVAIAREASAPPAREPAAAKRET